MALIYTADEVLVCGLSLVGIGEYRQKRQRRTTNLADFIGHFGVAPIVLLKGGLSRSYCTDA
jgi:hypothetical protein